jgi:hypothetical protein
MRKMLTVSLVAWAAVPAFAQNDTVKRETTTVTTTTTTTAATAGPSYDLLGLETFNFLDATTLQEGTVDLRLAGRWVQSKNNGNPYANSGRYGDFEDDDDDWILIPEIVWGAGERYELALSVPFWVEGEPYEGNYDSYVSGQWRISDLDENCPAFALAWSIRVPTGEGSNGLDGSLRLIITNEYESGMRSHFNIWGTSVNTDNYDARDFQYGAVVGLDGPLNDEGSLRWVFDYMYEISHQEGAEDMNTYYPYVVTQEVGGEGRNTAELGLQWQINECNKLGFAVQGGLDHSENETPEWAASLTYAYTIGN